MSLTINTRRASWAAAGLAAFQRSVGETDTETAIVDLIADLGHLAKQYKLDYIALLRRGIRSWAHEERDPNEHGMSPSVSIRIGPIRTQDHGKRRTSTRGAA